MLILVLDDGLRRFSKKKLFDEFGTVTDTEINSLVFSC